MSHSVVIVALPAGGDDVKAALDAALAPFDENREVEPYRDYETGSPREHWSWDTNPEIPEPTWAQVADAFNAKYGDEGQMLVGEDGRAYTLSPA